MRATHDTRGGGGGLWILEAAPPPHAIQGRFCKPVAACVALGRRLLMCVALKAHRPHSPQSKPSFRLGQ